VFTSPYRIYDIYWVPRDMGYQLINGSGYYLQQEWSNHSSKCVLTGT